MRCGFIVQSTQLLKQSLLDHGHVRGVEVLELCLSYENSDRFAENHFAWTAYVGAKCVDVGPYVQQQALVCEVQEPRARTYDWHPILVLFLT